jgi:UDP-glucuronate 4-epimerase
MRIGKRKFYYWFFRNLHQNKGKKFMKILVTGSEGLIGREIQRQFQEHEIIGFNRVDYWNDALNLYGYLNWVSPDMIINCAAELKEERDMFDINTGFVINNLFEYSKRNKTRLIQLGSSSEYGWHDHATNEQSALHVHDCYSSTKAATTLLLQGYSKRYDVDVKVIRPYSVYGADEKPYRFFRKLYNAFSKDEEMIVYEGVHDWIYVSDFVKGLKLIAEYPEKGFDIIGMGTEVQTSNFRCYDIFRKEFGVSAKNIKFQKLYFMTGNDGNCWQSDCSHARDKYGFNCELTLEEGIKKMIEQLKNVNKL